MLTTNLRTVIPCILNPPVRAVVNAPKFTSIILIVKPLQWLKINERVNYELYLLLVPAKFLVLRVIVWRFRNVLLNCNFI